MRRPLARSVTVAALVLAASAATADTIVPAGDLPSQTWTVAGSPYLVQGDIAIQPGFALAIEPGVMVVMTGPDSIEVRGTLHINGTAASPVTITGQSAVPGSWTSIDVVGSAANVRLDHVILEYPQTGVFLRSTTSTATFASTGLTVRDALTSSLRFDSGHRRLDRFTSIRSRYGILINDALLALTNCVLQGRPGAEVGILAHYVPSTAPPGDVVLEVMNCTIDGFGHGMTLAPDTGAEFTFVVTNSIVTRNNSRGIINSTAWGGTGVVDITHSNVWGNLDGNYDNVSPGANTISVDPGYESPTSLRLGLGSPCVDHGTNLGAPDHDRDGIARPIDADGVAGAVTDMGAYERVPGPSQCGNAVWEPGEACDDGAGNGQYGLCNATCTGTGPRCGDLIINGPEQCDDGNNSNTDACLSCRDATCGDGIVRTGVEVCDSGLANGQYGSCNTTCSGPGPRCGDALTNGPEQCDDGNPSNTDACLPTCLAARCGDGFLRAGVEACDDGNTSNTDTCVGACAVATCGDGFLRAGVEACDDGNTVDTDACRNVCIAASCGDGVVHVGVEACDDGNTVDTDACRNVCVAASCGDGVVHAGVEACDDGNTLDTDACRTTCIAASCGDGVVHAGVEACDDGNTLDTDACRTTCIAASCGDGIVQNDIEACDDGNTVDTDACRNVCIAASCGDGIVQGGVETCDDGNTAAGDGCDATCDREPAPDGGDGEMTDPAGGCCSTGGTSRDSGLLATLAVLIGLRRRRRRADG